MNDHNSRMKSKIVEEDEEIEEIDDREEESASFYTPFEIEARKEPVIESLHSDPEPKQDDHFAQFRNEKVKAEDSLDENDMNHEQADIESENHHSENEPMLENSSPAEIEEDEISEDEIEVEPEPEPEKKTSPEITFSAKRNEEQQPSLPVEEVMDEARKAWRIVEFLRKKSLRNWTMNPLRANQPHRKGKKGKTRIISGKINKAIPYPSFLHVRMKKLIQN